MHAVIYVEDINFIDYTLSREYLIVFRLAESVNTYLKEYESRSNKPPA